MYQKQRYVIKLQKRYEAVLSNSCIRMAMADALYLRMEISVSEVTREVEHAHCGMFLEDFFLDFRIKQIDNILSTLSEEHEKTKFVLFTDEDKYLYEN